MLNGFPMKKNRPDRLSPLRNLILCCVVTWAAAGCTVQQLAMGPMLDPADVAMDAQSVHFGELLNQLGPPHKISALPGGFVFLYEYYAPRGLQAGGRLPVQEADFLQWVRVDLGAGAARRQTLVLLFDDTGRLILQKRLQDEEEDRGAGASLSFLLKSGTMSDTVDIGSAADPNQWGASLLMPLGKALNREQNLGTGQSGVEQVGTTTKVGQQALELESD